MAVENVREYLKKFGKDKDVLEFDESSATVELAAKVVGVEPARIAKSIALYEDAAKSKVLLVVTAGDAKVDNRKFKSRFGCKASMCVPEDTLNATGHAVGGVCPFDLKTDLAVYLDRSLERFDSVFPAAGSSNSCVQMTLPELIETSGCKEWVDVCKGWCEE